MKAVSAHLRQAADRRHGDCPCDSDTQQRPTIRQRLSLRPVSPRCNRPGTADSPEGGREQIASRSQAMDTFNVMARFTQSITIQRELKG
ncbi:MAG: hypothetical protein MZV70_59755 [Desulfobacterales bacterium]|nr:hypothetical protein [Desulfobacterales bacterium]